MPPVQPYQPGPDTPAPRGPDAARGPDPLDPPLTAAERAALLLEGTLPDGRGLVFPTDLFARASLIDRGLLQRVREGDRTCWRYTYAGLAARGALLREADAALRAVYRRYRPGDPDPTPLGDCPATAGAFACTRPAGHRAPQHLAGTGRIVAATWTGDGDDLAVWDGGPDDLPEVPGPETGAPAEDPTGPARLDRLVNEGLDLVAALNACPSGTAGRLVLLASLELPRATVVALAGESAREVAARHLLTLGGSGDPDLFRFFGPAAAVAALLREVAGA